MDSKIESFIRRYVAAIDENDAAIFAGAGLSRASGMVDWKNLLRGIAQELGLDVNKEHDLIALAQYYKNEKGGRHELNQEILNQFTGGVNINENHKILASLPIKTYWTTNYDFLIEQSLQQCDKIPHVIKDPVSLTYTVRKDAIIYKMHGDAAEPEKAVITKDDYENYNETRQLFTIALKGDLVSKTFLFIGFSFDDPNLEYILSRIRILLGENTRTHYCFFKRVIECDFSGHDDYIYEKTKQELKIKDLLRYKIEALLVDDYSEITEVLRIIQKRIKARNVFISGAVEVFNTWNRSNTETFVNALTKKLISNNYSIFCGFGVNIGSSVINSVLELEKETNLKVDDNLILKPFPQNIENADDRKTKWHEYRVRMISNTGISIFIFGNKVQDGSCIISDGVIKEFEISHSLGNLIIPIGSTGSAALEIWTQIDKEFDTYFPKASPTLKEQFMLFNRRLDVKETIDNILNFITEAKRLHII